MPPVRRGGTDVAEGAEGGEEEEGTGGGADGRREGAGRGAEGMFVPVGSMPPDSKKVVTAASVSP